GTAAATQRVELTIQDGEVHDAPRPVRLRPVPGRESFEQRRGTPIGDRDDTGRLSTEERERRAFELDGISATGASESEVQRAIGTPGEPPRVGETIRHDLDGGVSGGSSDRARTLAGDRDG